MRGETLLKGIMFFRYPGGKRRLCSFVLEKLKNLRSAGQTAYCEPFWGAGNVGMSCIEELQLPLWANDKDAALIALWRCVHLHSEELIALVEQYKPCTEDFFSFKQELESEIFSSRFGESTLDVGFKKLACHQMSFGGCGEAARGPIGGKEQKSKWKIDCRWSPKTLVKKIRSLSKRLSNLDVRFTSIDFREVLATPEKMLVYLDPPYPTFAPNDRVYRLMLEQSAHSELAKLLQETHHDWVMSNEDNPVIRELYGWAKKDYLSINYSMSKKVKGEVLVCAL